MQLPFFNRLDELARLRRALDAITGNLVCIYGRRRLGKSRLLTTALAERKAVYYVADQRDGAVQRHDLAQEMDRVVPGMGAVTYPGWLALLEAWWRQAPAQSVLAIDELPWLAAAAPELPSLLQKLIDRRQPRHVVLCGSSSRMMHGLVLDSAAPLFGRATEILRLTQLEISWAGRAFGLRDPAEIVERYALWGGVPRYWELAADWPDMWSGLESLVLHQNGVLHDEPRRLLADELPDTVRPASLLAVVGQGCHRLAEIASRIGVPSTSLSRPLAMLVDLGFLRRDTPFGTPTKDAKRSLYKIADPLLDFFWRFVEPNRSRLGAGQHVAVMKAVKAGWPTHLGFRFEHLVRDRIGRGEVAGTTWLPASRYWGPSLSGAPIELDAVAIDSSDSRKALVVECKLQIESAAIPSTLEALTQKARSCPALVDKQIEVVLWTLRRVGRTRHSQWLAAKDLITNGDEKVSS